MIWLVFALMTAAAIGLLILPLLRSGQAGTARAEYDLTVYKDQLAELAQDVVRGEVSEAEAEAARTEIARRMLGAAEIGDAPATVTRPLPLAVGMALVVPVLAFGLYLMLGSPGLPDRPFDQRPAQAAPSAQAEMVANMVRNLSERLKTNPEDGKGWAMLARSYRVLGDAEGALGAYAQAAALLPKDIDLRLEYADLLLELIPEDQPRLPKAVVLLMKEILALDPTSAEALYYLGLDAAQAGDAATARAMWSKILAALPADSPGREELKRQIEQLK